jgi:glycogen debranching enzyme
MRYQRVLVKLSGGAIAYYASRIYLTNRTIPTEDGDIPPRTLGLTVSRSISGGMHEDPDVTNNNVKPVRFQLEIALRCDFADIFEVRSGRIVRRGRIATQWSDAKQSLSTTYRNGDFVRAVTVAPGISRARRCTPTAASASRSTSVPARLGTVACSTLTDGDRHFAALRIAQHSKKSPHAESLAGWVRTVLKIHTSNEEFYRLYRQALEDMAALRLPLPGTDHTVFLPAAGLPWFIAPFGRDSLIVSLQNQLIYPAFARGALEILGSLQAKDEDNYRDAEPGKIPTRCATASSRISSSSHTRPITARPTPRRSIWSRCMPPGERRATGRCWSDI